MELKKKNILIISPSPWDVSFPARQHYARELAKMGNAVYYLNPPSKLNSLVELSENLYIVDLKPISSLFGLLGPDSVLSKQIAKILSLVNKKIDIVWSFDLNRFPDLSKFGTNIVKILTIEEWPKEPGFEKQIAGTADLVLGLSQSLLDSLGNIKAKKQLFQHALGNVFVEALQRVDRIIENTQFTPGRLRCAYLGNLQNKYIDTASFESIIRENPMVEFHIVGPFVKESNLAGSGNKTWEDPFVEFLMSAPNVRMYGSLMTIRTAEILQTMDLFLVCYDTKRFIDLVANPQKIMEYFSVGKVVVASHTKNYEGQNGLLQMADETQQLPALFKKTVENLDFHNRGELAQARINFALEHTYDKQLLKIEQILTEIGK